MAYKSAALMHSSMRLLSYMERRTIHSACPQWGKISDVGDKAQNVVDSTVEKVTDVGKAIKDKVKARIEKMAPAGQGTKHMDETGYENARESNASARDATSSGKGAYPSGDAGRMTEKNFRELTEKKLEHAKKTVEEKLKR